MGPLSGIGVLEVAGIGPGPFACMMLADLGADVVRIERVRGAPTAGGAVASGPADLLARGRRSVALDLKDERGVAVALRLAERADVLVEGFRPGVAERLGIGPQICLSRNHRLVYGRITGWGQTGPEAHRAGHDLDYIAAAGALHALGPAGAPPPVPLNYVADFGGGGMLLALGVACALVERAHSGHGQVVDAAMVDGVATMTTMFHGLLAAGQWEDRREANLLDGAAPFYRCYACADGYVAVAALEPRFYAELLERLRLAGPRWAQHDRGLWPAQRAALAEIFAARTRQEWERVFAGSDACVAAVRSLREAPDHPQLAARDTFTTHAGVRQPAPAPRFSRTPGRLDRPPPAAGAHTDEVLAEAGYDADDVATLRAAGVIG